MSARHHAALRVATEFMDGRAGLDEAAATDAMEQVGLPLVPDLMVEVLDLADVLVTFGRAVRRSEPQRIPQLGDRHRRARKKEGAL